MQNTTQVKHKLIIFNKTGNPCEFFYLEGGVTAHLGLGLLLFRSEGKAYSIKIEDLHSYDVVID